ncbi:MAG TPA: serine/threonine-protein kinase, partial [Polyangiaceae bacterium]|nr:serine/threonine-protein kinase [Polyangiaceae bacterium]
IASGGMATVYLARTRGAGGFERDVALKLTHAHLRETEDFARELIEEAKLAVGIRHANVVPVLDVGEDPEGIFLVMDYIEGEALATLMRRAAKAGTRLDPAVGMRILLDALAGLHAAHELADERGKLVGLVHRDVSPQNILVGLDGVSRLADFGVAKAATRLGQTRTGLIKGKLAYMAPEQARDQPLDRRTDVWAAGVIAWEILAGRRLLRSRSEAALLLELVSTTPRRLSSVCPDIPAALDDVVARALSPEPQARWSTAQEFAAALQAACDGHLPRLGSAEVADYVRSLVGEDVTERRARASEIARTRSDAVRIEAPAVSSLGDATDTTSAAPPSLSSSSPRRSLLAPLVLAGAALVGGGLAVAWRLPRSGEPLRAALPTSLSVPTPSASAVAPTPATDVLVTANVPIASLQIDARVVTVPAPATSIRLALLASEGKTAAKLVARSVDGRTAATTLEPGAARVDMVFSAPPSRPNSPSRRLAKSPYAPKP